MDTKVHHTSYECIECGRKFSAPQALRIHSRMHDGRKMYQCKDCGKTFRMEFYFKYHRMNDTGINKFECGICEKKFSNISCVDTHYKIHSNEKSYVCRKCGKVYIQLGSFKNHVMAHPPTFTCKECGKIFTDKASLTSHEQAHVSQKPYECLNCGKRFAHSFNLEIHSESYCTFQREERDPGNDTDMKDHQSAWQDKTCISKRGGGGRKHSVKVEVIDLGSDSEPEEVQPDDFLPLEVCLNEGEEELSIRDLMERYEDKDGI
ncbi:putative zinc finger protein 833 [Scylla paramamosain]|uniref:putative zinc finger protein 833 n=1 Tax=Scylla paramamosain TaxID=85552 RepID=UPI00308384E6